MSGKHSLTVHKFVLSLNFFCSGETEFLDVWDDAYAAVMRYARAKDSYWVMN